MLVLTGCVFIGVLMYFTLRGGLVGHNSVTIVGKDIEGLGLGVLSFAAAAWFFGPLFGFAIVLSVMIHEFGHVVAFRIAGHQDARFRLIPLMGGVAISDTPPETQLDDFFISIMGPAICLVPMVLALAAMDVALMVSPLLEEFLWVFAITTGALNFFNLLPFWPLDGGRCMRVITDTFAPKSTTFVTLAMSAALAAAAVAMQSVLLTVFAIMSAQTLFFASGVSIPTKRLTLSQGIVASGAYLFTMGAHFAGGYAMIARYL